jgi:uncharacterized protein with FMN-binding domain
MKRAPWYLAVGAVAGFAGVLGLHGRTAATPAQAQRPGSGAGRIQSGQSGSSSTSGASGSSAPAGASGGAQAASGLHSATGAMEQYGYGELTVRITVNGNRITNVTVPTLRTAEPYSQQLAQQVIPMLKSQVLAADGPHINGVSGATYTSQAYATSVQAALDKLHLR